jgi:hypothetical protein
MVGQTQYTPTHLISLFSAFLAGKLHYQHHSHRGRPSARPDLKTGKISSGAQWEKKKRKEKDK